MWTIERVKIELPEVQCKFGKVVYQCRTQGRMNQFCTVWVIIEQHLQAEFSWETIVMALNNNKPLIA